MPPQIGGRLLLELDGDVLLAANTGAPLDLAGVAGASSLRASAKTGGVGRFGVGFAAVVAVSDAPSMGSRDGLSVAWSRERTRAEIAGTPALQAVSAARGGDVPVLRLPFGAPPADVPPGYDTVVRLPLRDDAARAATRTMLKTLDPALLLVLPGLDEITVRIDGTTIRALRRGPAGGGLVDLDGRRWAVVRRAGEIPPELLAERPVEERGRTTWEVLAAAPVHGGFPPDMPRVLRAPTPSDEPLSLPVVLAASLPLEPTRRRLAPGRLTDLVLAEAGRAVAELAVAVDDPLPLIPTGLAAGPPDAAVRAALIAALPGLPVLPGGLRGDRATVLDVGPAADGLAAVLGEVTDGLLDPAFARLEDRSRAAALDALGVRRLDLAAVVDLLAGLDAAPGWWRRLYAALAPLAGDPALAGLPVPLVDGRLVTGARGALLPTGPLPAGVATLPLRVVDPAAAHPLLERLGALPADAAGLLADPALQVAVTDDPTLVPVVAGLVREAGVGRAELRWLARLPLPDTDGGSAEAGDLLWPGGLMDRVLAPGTLPRLACPAWLDRDLAVAFGVLDGPALLTARDVPLDPDAHPEPDDEPAVLDLDGAADWLAAMAGRLPADGAPELAEVVAPLDLDLVADVDGLLAGLAADPELRRVLLTPVRAGVTTFTSYAAWWIGQRPLAGGPPAAECALPGDPLLTGLYAPAPAGVDEAVLTALGVRRSLADVLTDPDATGDQLDRLGDAERDVPRAQTRAVYAAAARAWGDRDDPPAPPLAVRAALPAGSGALGAAVAVPAADAVVADVPDLLPLTAARGLAVVGAPASVARALARLLDLPLLSELVVGAVDGGVETAVPQPVRELLPTAPRTWRRHDELVVDGVGLGWRWTGDVLHATPTGLGPGLAWAAGRWELRAVATALLAPGADVGRLLAEADLDGLDM